MHRKRPLHFCHVTPRTERSTRSDLWTDIEIERQQSSLEHLKQQLPSLTEAALAQYAEESLLFFWAHLAFFKVTYVKTTQSQPASSYTEYSCQTRPIVQDGSGNTIGTVCKTATAGGGRLTL